MAFQEDQRRVRGGCGAVNFSILRRMALALLKKEQTAKTGVANRRLAAGGDESYLEKVLAGE